MNLSTRLGALAERMLRVAESAAGRTLTRNQTTEFRSIVTDLGNLMPDVRSHADADDTLAKILDNLATSAATGTTYIAMSRYLDDAARRVALLERSPELDAARGEVERFIATEPQGTRLMNDTRAGGPSIHVLWDQYRTAGYASMDAELSPSFQTRALASAGGSAIATTFADQVVVYQRTVSPMLNPDVVTISTSTSGAAFKVPRLTADATFAGTVTAEAAAFTVADPTISAADLTPYKYGGITLWSAELDQDEIIDLQPLIARSHGRSIAIGAGAHMTTGDGSGKPTGFITSATNGGTATKAFGGTATTFFDYRDLVSLWSSVAAPYRSVGAWQLSTDAFVKASTFRTDDGNLAMLPGLGGAQPTIMGRPVYENPSLAAVGSASKSVAFGDFKQYWVRRVTPLRVDLSRDYAFNTDQVALKVVDRLDGELIDAAAVAFLVSANT